jgi:hypothetical protein
VRKKDTDVGVIGRRPNIVSVSICTSLQSVNAGGHQSDIHTGAGGRMVF